MAEKHIKSGALFRGIVFALLTFALGVWMVFWVTHPLPDTPLWVDRILAVLTAIAVGLGVRRVLSEDRTPSPSVLVWTVIWTVITYVGSGLLLGPNPHSQLLETLGVEGGFGLLLSSLIIGWVISVNGFTFITKSLEAWVAKTGHGTFAGGIVLWLIAMVMTGVGFWVYPELNYHWLEIGGYWALTIILTSLFELEELTFIE